MSIDPQRRLTILRMAILLLFLVLVGRLWQLQVLRGEEFLRLSEENRIRSYPVTAPRGLIYDRQGKPLLSNRPSFTVSVLPMEVQSSQEFALLGRLLGMDPSEIAGKVQAAIRYRPFEPVRIARDVSLEVVTKIEERRLELPGILIQAEPVRHYLYGKLAAHVLGYLGEISEEELKVRKGQGYSMGDLIGKTGIERMYDRLLRGTNGRLQVEVDAMGRPLRVLGSTPPTPGNSLVLSLDVNLQRAAEEALGDRKGAIVAMDPKSGEILALVSHPAFDPNLFAVGISAQEWKRIMTDPGLPLLNRAVDMTYEPGSVFKIVTALAAVDAGVATERTTINCPGFLRLGKWVFKDWKAHGRVNFIEGVAQSCNVMFWILGRQVGPERLAEYARRLGMGRPTGIDLPSEAKGLIPDPAWKEQEKGELWYPGETLNMAIGQGYVQVSPLQVARAISAIANGGFLPRPHLLRSVLAPDGSVLERVPHGPFESVPVRPRSLQVLREGMIAVVTRGTGRSAAVSGLSIAGKTGSAENPLGEPHAWFGGFAPAEDPQLVVVVLVEFGRRGGVAAAPIARQIFAAYFSEVGRRPGASYAGGSPPGIAGEAPKNAREKNWVGSEILLQGRRER
ncbi:MAG: penicillin-binding protein 2 [Armatimonadota bacterium]|nr:penicillin-binding protein 2 [Armatimonadota bacterium]